LSTTVQVRITKKLEELEINPHPPDLKKRQGYEKRSRVRGWVVGLAGVMKRSFF
jgi:hypothetical protein